MAIGKHRVRVIAIVAIGVAIVVAWYGWHRSQHGDGGGSRAGGGAAVTADRDDGPASGALARGGAKRNAPTAIDPLITPMPVSIAGRVLDRATHVPVAGVDVELVGVAKGAGDIIATSDVNGGYHADVTTGAWDVRAQGPGVIAAPVRVMVATTSGGISHDVLVERAGTIHGRVVDGKGAPIADATVSIETTGNSVSCGGDGTYSIEVPPGEAQLRADAATGTGFGLAPAVPPGGDLALDIVIPEAVTISGHVLDDQATAIAGAEITAISRDPDGAGVIRLTGASDASGAFQIAIHPGVISLEARHDGDGTSGTTRLKLTDPGGHADVTLTLGAAIALAGTVINADGPVQGARVHARLAGNASALATAVSDDQGHFAFEGARAGHYAIDASADGQLARLQLDLTAETPPIEIKLALAGGIQGTVTFDGADSAQASDVTVTIERFVPDGDDHEARVPFSRQTFAGAEGFRLGGLAAGRYDLIVSATGHGAAHLPGIQVKDSVWTDVTANLPTSARLTGTVTANGQPVAGARVAIDGGVASAFTDDDGKFAFSAVAPGPVMITVTDAGHRSAQRSAIVGADGAQVTIELPNDGTRDVEGIGVVLAAGAGAPIVTAVTHGAPAWGQVPVGATVVAIDGIPADAGLSAAVARIRGPAGSKVTLTLEADGERWDATLVRARVRVHTVLPTVA